MIRHGPVRVRARAQPQNHTASMPPVGWGCPKRRCRFVVLLQNHDACQEWVLKQEATG